MITEKGVIKAVKGNKAFVKVQRTSGCGHCSSQGLCRSIGDSENKEMIVEVMNDVHAQVGDEVEISLPTGSFLKISFFVCAWISEMTQSGFSISPIFISLAQLIQNLHQLFYR